jgi:hypothetical protein
MFPPQAGQATQLIVAAQPELTVEPSEVNLKVRQPVDEVNVPGKEEPLYVPNKVELVFGPS